MKTSTKITTLFDEDSQDLMTGEMYPIYSDDGNPILSEIQAKELLNGFHQLKLNRYYDCINKAKIVAAYCGINKIYMGSLMVDSIEKGVKYGYEYNPPLELHAWVQIGMQIIDFALAGTIEKGLRTKDDIGCFLVDRKPIILAGYSPSWVHYTVHEIVPVEKIKQLDKETAKELLNNIKWK